MIDILDAYDMIDHLVETIGADNKATPFYVNGMTNAPECIVGTAWFFAGVSTEELLKLGSDSPRMLYKDGRLPLEMTLGAVEVFTAAQLAQDKLEGTWGDAREAASRIVEKFIDIMPLTIVPDFAEVEEQTLVNA